MSLMPGAKRRPFVPLGLTLGALLCSLSALADVPAAPTVSVGQAQTVFLQHTVPGDILKTLHWDHTASLPLGVTQISAQPATNSLSVIATPAGLAQVRQIIKVMDIEPRQVQIKFALVKTTTAALDSFGVNFALVPMGGLQIMPTPNHPPTDKRAVPSGFIGYAYGGVAAQLLQALTKRGTVLQLPTVTTTNNVQATLNLTGGQPIPALPEVEAFTYTVTPRVNSDDSVTLALHPQATLRVAGVTNPDGTPATARQDLQTLRTVRSGETMVLTNLFPGAAGTGDSQLLLFVTPTIVGVANSPATITVK